MFNFIISAVVALVCFVTLTLFGTTVNAHTIAEDDCAVYANYAAFVKQLQLQGAKYEDIVTYTEERLAKALEDKSESSAVQDEDDAAAIRNLIYQVYYTDMTPKEIGEAVTNSCMSSVKANIADLHRA